MAIIISNINIITVAHVVILMASVDALLNLLMVIQMVRKFPIFTE
jgi:hypothetical protein